MFVTVDTPPGRLGQTMGAAEVGRELGAAGGPVLVGAFGLISLAAGFGALAAVLTAVHFSIGLTLLTIFDAVLVWLTWREYQARRTRRHPAKTPTAAGK